jgi:formylglycine-generating enzyme
VGESRSRSRTKSKETPVFQQAHQHAPVLWRFEGARGCETATCSVGARHPKAAQQRRTPKRRCLRRVGGEIEHWVEDVVRRENLLSPLLTELAARGFLSRNSGASATARRPSPKPSNPDSTKPMQTQFSKRILTASAAVLCAFTVTSAHADTFGSGGNIFTIDFVNIGNPGNANDSGTTGSYSSPYGGVAYEFRMGTYEISEDMITKANAAGGLLITKDTRTSVNQAATGVSWNEAARFVNWLNVSSGYAAAYKFAVNPGDGGYTSNTVANADIALWLSGDAGYDASNPYRNSNARYVLPSEHEWYKAAYYSGSGTTYFDYATGSDTIPTAVASGTGAGTAVFNGGAVVAPANITQAGGLSAYGTMGQNGNVWEWQESAMDGSNTTSSENRAARGGYWLGAEETLRSSLRTSNIPSSSDIGVVGFRVASVPEPSCAVLMISAGLLALARRRRRAAL